MKSCHGNAAPDGDVHTYLWGSLALTMIWTHSLLLNALSIHDFCACRRRTEKSTSVPAHQIKEWWPRGADAHLWNMWNKEHFHSYNASLNALSGQNNRISFSFLANNINKSNSVQTLLELIHISENAHISLAWLREAHPKCYYIVATHCLQLLHTVCSV